MPPRGAPSCDHGTPRRRVGKRHSAPKMHTRFGVTARSRRSRGAVPDSLARAPVSWTPGMCYDVPSMSWAAATARCPPRRSPSRQGSASPPKAASCLQAWRRPQRRRQGTPPRDGHARCRACASAAPPLRPAAARGAPAREGVEDGARAHAKVIRGRRACARVRTAQLQLPASSPSGEATGASRTRLREGCAPRGARVGATRGGATRKRASHGCCSRGCRRCSRLAAVAQSSSGDLCRGYGCELQAPGALCVARKDTRGSRTALARHLGFVPAPRGALWSARASARLCPRRSRVIWCVASREWMRRGWPDGRTAVGRGRERSTAQS